MPVIPLLSPRDVVDAFGFCVQAGALSHPYSV